MKIAPTIIQFGIISVLGNGVISSTFARPAPQTEIHVTLLGQPCLLQGPFDQATLRTIHAIGPAQIYPTISVQSTPKEKEDLQKAFEQVKGSTSLPSLLDRYRDKLSNRLKAQLAFLTAIDDYKITHQPARLQKIGKEYLTTKGLRLYLASIKKLETSKKNPTIERENLEKVFDTYNEEIEPDPESEFHRAIKKLNVQYTCSFEDTEEFSDE